MPNPDKPAASRFHCPAKLNLTLAVGPPRDDGLHPIASVMVTIAFGDTLSLRPARYESRFTRRFAEGAPPHHRIDWPIEDDLVFHAHALMEQQAGIGLPIECDLVKQIPPGSGLGGGSSDAAAVLVGLREVFDLPLPDQRLIELGASLGADVCFAVHARLNHNAALVTGIGEALTPITSLPAFDLVLVFPEGRCPTGEVYRAYDAMQSSREPVDTEAFTQSWSDPMGVPPAHNDLTDAAIRVCPAVGEAASVLGSLNLEPRLTGSGSALFVVADDADHARRIVAQAREAGLSAAATAYDPKPRS